MQCKESEFAMKPIRCSQEPARPAKAATQVTAGKAAAATAVPERGWAKWCEGLGIFAVLAVAVYFIVLSWRKWCHPSVDSGRELYTPWRLSEGAVLYRDVDDVYGPLSQYFNAGLFKVFGPGMMVLAVANLVIFAGILGLIYGVFRRGWGAAGAVGASVVWVTFYGFCPWLNLTVFNYALPYAHEATHGMLVLVGLIFVLGRWVESPAFSSSAMAGLLVGLTCVLKPEFMLAAVALAVSAARLRGGAAPGRRGLELLFFAVAAVVPTAAFTGYFSRYFPLGEAVGAAGRAWWSLLIMPDIVGQAYQQWFIGLDRPWSNLVVHLRETAMAVSVLGGLGVVVAFGLRRNRPGAKIAVVSVAAVAALAVGFSADWGNSGRSLLGLVVGYGAFTVGRAWRGGAVAGAIQDPRLHWRILIATAAVAMMARMLLNGRIFQFGFFQAALAGLVVTAVMVAEAAEWLPAAKGRRRAVAIVAAALLAPGLWFAGKRAQGFYSFQTYAVAEGRDRFYHFPADIEASGQLLNEVVAVLRALPRETTLLALPEGSMVNYLARLKSPLPQFQYYSFTTEGGRETGIVAALRAHPPDRVVVFSRFGLGDFGITRYGERDGAGREIIEWVNQNYRITHRFGGDPLATDQRGAYVLERVRE